MIGILCNSNKIKKLSLTLQNFLNSYRTDESFAVFSIDTIDLVNNTFNGYSVNNSKIEKLHSNIPSVIFNFSKQIRLKNTKKLRKLEETTNIVNASNNINQFMIMQILSSHDNLKKHVLPFKKIDKNTFPEDLSKEKNCLIIPKKFSSTSKLFYIKLENYLYLDEDTLSKMGYIIKCPNLLTSDKKVVVFRTYFQKGNKGEWTLLVSSISTNKITLKTKVINQFQDLSLSIINYVSKFMPSLGNCFIDLIIDSEFNAYFLHAGGWGYNVIDYISKENLQNDFCNNLINYYNYCSSK